MKIFLDTIGCRLNQAEIEKMAGQFRSAGHEIVGTAAGADLAVVNTCTVTAEAASDSRGKVRQAARLGATEIAITGCWATLEPLAAAGLPNVTHIIPNARKETLVSDLLNLELETLRESQGGARNLALLKRIPLPGSHARTRAFIKAQYGCNNHCTFCITAIARGSGCSMPVQDVLADVHSALAGGTKEIVLTGVHLGSWGQDFGLHLPDLVKAILGATDVPRLRLSSLEPWDLDADFFALWKDPRLCRHLHLPLQSGSLSVLRRMARRTTPEAYATLVETARSAIPDVAITTDIIAGFPGETEAEFSETLDFVRKMDFARGHVFTYSPRPGTAAARMDGQIRHEVKKKRNAALRAVFLESGQAFMQKFLGRSMSVLWESCRQVNDSGWYMEGLTDNYLRVCAITPRRRWNEMDEVELREVGKESLRAEIVWRLE